MKTIATTHDAKGRLTGIVSGPDFLNVHIKVWGRIWRFDYDRYMGPLWLKADGSARKCQNPNKAVWNAFEKWRKSNIKS